MSLVFAADIGGTNSRFAIYAKSKATPEFQTTLKTSAYNTFAELLTDLKQKQTTVPFSEIKSAVFAIAGPVVDPEDINPPNIPWNIARSEIKKILGIDKSKLINDFQAQALGVITVDSKFVKQIIKGKLNNTYPKAVIGAGTGFGKALLINTEKNKYISLASEGGHNEFPVSEEREIEFYKFALKKFRLKNLMWDDVLSGRGLQVLHEFLTEEVLEAAAISAEYLSKENETLNLFARFYGRAARTYVLETMALGGLFIAGGVAAKNPLVISSESFRASFLQSKYADILANIPISLVESDDNGLKGAAFEAFQLSS